VPNRLIIRTYTQLFKDINFFVVVLCLLLLIFIYRICPDPVRQVRIRGRGWFLIMQGS